MIAMLEPQNLGSLGLGPDERRGSTLEGIGIAEDMARNCSPDGVNKARAEGAQSGGSGEGYK